MSVIFLETERLLLRQFTSADVDNLFELDSDPDVMRYINGGSPTPREVIATDILPHWLGRYEQWKEFGTWAAIEKATGDFLGWFHFRPLPGAGDDEADLGYRLRKSAWGKGYATEGSRALIHKGFSESGVQRVVASTMIDNVASRRVMEKSGLTLVGTAWGSRPDVFDRLRIPCVEYALLRSDWELDRESAALPTVRTSGVGRRDWGQSS
jgi:RimJ/RimL family protein N-acetyltransferase